MLKKIKFIKYKKLENMEISFNEGVNIISGANGTCKTSLLHIISNSVQEVKKGTIDLINADCIKQISSINSVINPKIESLSKGDKKYNDPAKGITGSLFEVEYFNHPILGFRRHNSKLNCRYSVKPKYQRGSGDHLPYCPVIYLSLNRLIPFGEFQDESKIKLLSKNLPTEYLDLVSTIYKDFTNYEICTIKAQSIDNIKYRADFETRLEGIDSNTISAGEDNLYIIITALVSLRYYFDNLRDKSNECTSILLIDELDATLHPAYQIKLLNLFKEYAEKYKIQIVFTTHSMTLLEEAFNKKINVIYLINNIQNIILMPHPNIYKIKLNLSNLTRSDLYKDRKIPIFAEDDEARLFIEELLDYFTKIHKDEFSFARNHFHFVKANVSAENLKAIFSDSLVIRMSIRSICILDGDKESNLSLGFIKLPGNGCPEQILFNYLKKLYDDPNAAFWTDDTVIYMGYQKTNIKERILDKIEQKNEEIEQKKARKESTKGLRREFNKDLFNDNKEFMQLLIRAWIQDSDNNDSIKKFYEELRVLFKQIAAFNDIDPNDWR